MTTIRLSVCVVTLLLASLAQFHVQAQTQQENQQENQQYKKTPWGDPHIEGLWDYRTLTPLQRPDEFGDKATLSPAEAAAFKQKLTQARLVDGRGSEDAAADLEGSYNDFWFDWGTQVDVRTSLLIDPPNGKLPPLTAAARAQLKENNTNRKPPVRDMFSYAAGVHVYRPLGPEWLGLSERCLVGFNAGPPLNPSAYNNNLRIVQTPDYVLLVTEMIHNARVVPLNRTHAQIEQWSGVAQGRWEGVTLVVETRNFSGKVPTYQLPATLADAAESGAVGKASDMHLVERFTRQADGIRYEYTLTDLQTFTAPFTVALNLKPASGKMFEYACHEGNYAMGGVLRGARLADKEEAQLHAAGTE